MRETKFIIVALVSLASSSFSVFGQSFFDTVPLVTKRAEIEKVMLVNPTKNTTTEVYDTKIGRLYVNYSAGRCADSPNSEWDVEKDTVTYLSFFPSKPQRFEFDESYVEYEVFPTANDLPGLKTLRNAKLGRSLTVDNRIDGRRTEFITSYSFFPKAEHASLRCQRSNSL